MLKEEQKNRQVKIMFETNKEGKQVVAAGSASDLLSSLIDKEYIGKWLWTSYRYYIFLTLIYTQIQTLSNCFCIRTTTGSLAPN